MPDDFRKRVLAQWELLRKAPPDVQRAEVAKYNQLAARTRKDNPAGKDPKLADDELGLTAARLPDAPRDWEQLPNQVPTIPMPFGANQLPYGNRYPGAAPEARITLRPGSGREVAEHEQLHVKNLDPSDPGEEFRNAGLKDRVLYRAVKANANEAEPHAVHQELAARRAQIVAEIAERQRVLDEIDARTKAVSKSKPKKL